MQHISSIPCSDPRCGGRPVVAWLIMIGVLTTLPTWSVRGTYGADGSAPHRYVVGVSGMVCPSTCITHVRLALETMPEVAGVEIDFAAKTATITTRDAQTLTKERVHTVLKGSGFGVTTFARVPGS